MTLKVIKKGLTESKEQCPNCDSYINIFKDEKGRIERLNGAHSVEGKAYAGTISCDNCYSELKAE